MIADDEIKWAIGAAVAAGTLELKRVETKWHALASA
jgi:hypothetical protein